MTEERRPAAENVVSLRDYENGIRRPRMLDLYCCQGGASMGYHDAEFEVVGVDIDPQPHYPFEFVQMGALDALKTLIGGGRIAGYELEDFDAAHGSPPCQAHTKAWKINKRDHPKLIAPTRELLVQTGLPWVIENVEEARDELRDPVMLCGEMFGIETYRHRLFESTFPIDTPEHPRHVARTTKMGRPPVDGEYMHVVGNFSGVNKARGVMGMPWATRDGLREAIPPVYAEHVGRAILAHLDDQEAAA